MRSFLLALLVLVLAPPAAAQDPTLDPSFGDVLLDEGFTPDPYEVELTAGGPLEPAVDGCAFGYVAEAPDADLYYTTSGGSDLYVFVVSSEDTTLLINLPDGSWVCDDDGYGDGDPLVAIPGAAEGLYDIWIGTYGEEPAAALLYLSEVDPR